MSIGCCHRQSFVKVNEYSHTCTSSLHVTSLWCGKIQINKDSSKKSTPAGPLKAIPLQLSISICTKWSNPSNYTFFFWYALHAFPLTFPHTKSGNCNEMSGESGQEDKVTNRYTVTVLLSSNKKKYSPKANMLNSGTHVAPSWSFSDWSLVKIKALSFSAHVSTWRRNIGNEDDCLHWLCMWPFSKTISFSSVSHKIHQNLPVQIVPVRHP